MAEVRIDGQAHISKIPNTYCRTRTNKKINERKNKLSQTTNKQNNEHKIKISGHIFEIQVQDEI